MIVDVLTSFSTILDKMTGKENVVNGITTLFSSATKKLGNFGNAAKLAGTSLLKFFISPVGAVVGVLGIAAIAIANHKRKMEELRKETDEAATSYKESSQSIEDYVGRYQELQQALKDAKGNEEETYNVKKQLLELQTELNDKFGEEYGKLNLVTDAYRDQTEAIKAYNKEAANTFLNENYKGIETAIDKMTEMRNYNLGTNIYQLGNRGEALKKLTEKYSDKGIKFTQNDASLGEHSTYTITLTADAQSAYEVTNEFITDLRELAKELGDEHIFDDIISISTKSLEKSQKILDNYGTTYNQALTAQLVTDDEKSVIYKEAIEAVEEYNDAVLHSESPFNDETVETARQKINDLKQILSADEWSKYMDVFDDIFDQTDMRLVDFYSEFSNNTYLQSLANTLKDYDDVTIEAMANDGARDNFDELMKYAENYGLEIADVISLLKELGYIQSIVLDSEVANKTLSFTEVQSNIQNLSKGLDQLDSIYADILNKEDFDYSSILNNDDFKNTFGNLDEYDEFIKTIANSNGDINACQTAFDNLSTAYIRNSEALKGVTEESKNATIAQLEQMGIANAEEMVMAELGLAIEDYDQVKKQATANGIDLTNATWAEIDALVTEGIVAGESATALFYYQFQKALSNDNPINTIEDCNQLYALAVRCGATSEVLEDLIRLRQIYETLADSSLGLSQYDMNDLLAQANALQSSIKKQVEGFESSYEPVARYTGGLKSVEEASKGAKDATDALKEAIQQEIDALERQKEALQDSLNELDELYDAIQWVLDGKIEDIDDIIEKIQEENDALAEQREIYDNILSVVDSVYNAEIEAIQEKIDALSEENDEKEKAIALEKARQKVEEMRNNKSILQYTADKGYIYTVDEAGLKEAEDEYADLAQELEESKIKKELEDQIELLEKYRDMWGEIPEAFEKSMNELEAMKHFGADWKNAILNSDEGAIGEFQGNYTGLQENEKANEDKISYYEEEKKKIEDLKELWEDAKNAYRDSQYEAKLASFFGSDYEHQILNNSLTWRTQFTNEYCSLQMQIADIEERIKALNEQSANIVADSANKVSTALNQTTDAVNGLKESIKADDTSGNLLSGVESSVDKSLLQIESLKLALSDLDLARKTLKETIDAEIVDTSNLVGETQAKVQEINIAISSLLLSIRLLRINIEELLNTLLIINDTVTLDRIITLIGSGEEGSLLGAINSVINKLSGESEGLLYELNQLNEKQLDLIIAEFNGDESLLSAIREVSSAILSDGDECLISKINKITDTIGNIDAVKNSFNLLESQIDNCVIKVDTLNEKIQSLQDKTVTITVDTVFNGVSGVTDVFGNSYSNFTYGRATGGIIGKEDENDLDHFARAAGEDHMVALTEGEAVIPVDTVKANPELVNGLLNANGKAYTIVGNSFEKDGNTFTPVSVPNLFDPRLNGFDLKFATPKFDKMINPGSYVNNTINNGNGISITIGDIHLSGVQDVSGLSNAIINKLPNTLIQALGRI